MRIFVQCTPSESVYCTFNNSDRNEEEVVIAHLIPKSMLTSLSEGNTVLKLF